MKQASEAMSDGGRRHTCSISGKTKLGWHLAVLTRETIPARVSRCSLLQPLSVSVSVCGCSCGHPLSFPRLPLAATATHALPAAAAANVAAEDGR